MHCKYVSMSERDLGAGGAFGLEQGLQPPLLRPCALRAASAASSTSRRAQERALRAIVERWGVLLLHCWEGIGTVLVYD